MVTIVMSCPRLRLIEISSMMPRSAGRRRPPAVWRIISLIAAASMAILIPPSCCAATENATETHSAGNNDTAGSTINQKPNGKTGTGNHNGNGHSRLGQGRMSQRSRPVHAVHRAAIKSSTVPNPYPLKCGGSMANQSALVIYNIVREVLLTETSLKDNYSVENNPDFDIISNDANDAQSHDASSASASSLPVIMDLGAGLGELSKYLAKQLNDSIMKKFRYVMIEHNRGCARVMSTLFLQYRPNVEVIGHAVAVVGRKVVIGDVIVEGTDDNDEAVEDPKIANVNSPVPAEGAPDAARDPAASDRKSSKNSGKDSSEHDSSSTEVEKNATNLFHKASFLAAGYMMEKFEANQVADRLLGPNGVAVIPVSTGADPGVGVMVVFRKDTYGILSQHPRPEGVVFISSGNGKEVERVEL